jgi:hypothetical protein
MRADSYLNISLIRSRFGRESTRMGPVIEEIRHVFPPLLHGRTRLYHTLRLLSPTPIDDEMSDADKAVLDFENERIRRARRIRDQLSVLLDTASTIKQTQGNIRVSGPSSHCPFPPRSECPKSTRFNEIRDYLFENRLELALDTLNFQMPEHIMYAHILRNGKIDLTADEWRSFLEVCHYKKLFFT